MNEDEAVKEFAKAEAKYREVAEEWKGVSTSEEAAQKILQEAITILLRCRKAVFESLSVFSKNEIIQEVGTRDLSFLLCDYYLARLENLVVPKKLETTDENAADMMIDPDVRLQQLLKSIRHFLNFMTRLKQLEALDAETIRGLDNVTTLFSKTQEDAESSSISEAKSIAETNAAKSKKMAPTVIDPAVLRTMKIERFKATKNAEKLLAEVQSKIQRAQDVEDSDSENELVRSAKLIILQNASRNALDEMDGIVQELEIVYHMKRLKIQDDKKRQITGASTSSSVSASKASSTAKPKQQNGPGISVTRIGPNHEIKREVIKAKVFQPGYRQATMTIEEFGELEMKKIAAAAASASTKEAVQPSMKQKTLEENGLEDDMKLVDKATIRDRNWDDWKDDHTKGAGVTKRF